MTALKTLAVASMLTVSPLVAGAGFAQMASAPGNVVEVASEAGTFETLLAAATAAGLADALATTDDITVFAPSDEAFAALPEGTVEGLLEDTDALAAILTAHVVPSVIMSGDIAEGDTEVATLNEDAPLTVTNDGMSVTVSLSNTATVVTADVEASNGVIHVIDAVLLP
ncbi:fasciclin domain-containing protein [Pelagibacterium montanilacus]|uniref:fasciclin domain-containing protein n=1 Tax=Pelagibacterium montanilacus TaxID=2185280 RepID=UPI0019D2711F|nr:fasciclin domain-containing protein [Pelagibacterium montanilacus]